MVNDMHTQTTLPNPPASARPARSKPRIGGVVFQFISTMLMINGYKGLGHIDIPDYLVPKGIGFDRFLTNWGLVMAIITTSLGVLSDVLPGVTAIRSVKRAFLLIAFPLAITISSIYWPLVLIAPYLILPQKSSIGSSSGIVGEPSSSPDTPEMFRLPLWIDLSLHALPTAVLFVGSSS
ncbi:FAR-17a/AIG1-like protein-domain-containing protein [Filobasidium floriforme]|uniref:FAR-17a/AIG1-like protein-domain-containing protein n=1 Tax=Filobasidium floriforme TaxID=5210 RepID=UPI001E8DB56D|nr:FAR-17a/AIG1-like protein-domain-containing protein [Filobasidium floriforme]KAH8078245.1 FAR-17a/AIG1-like protein-domain-containing protein [Filobasidium floriforme]